METEKYYEILIKKLDNAIQGLSKQGTKGNVSETWKEYLHVLVDPNDVKYLIELDVFPAVMSAKKFAKKINKSIEEAEEILDRLIKQDTVMIIGTRAKKYSIHMPFMMFDAPPLSYDKYPKEKAQKLAELSLKYLIEEEWYRNFEGSPQTPLTRIIPVQESVDVTKKILPYEDVINLIEEAEIISIQKCACRTRYDFLGTRKCDHPLESCFGVDQGAKFFIERGHAREISKDEAKEMLKEFNKMGLVHTTENYQEGAHSLICNCCACCCSLLGGITRWDNPRAVAASNFVAINADLENCARCETCIENCNFKAIVMEDDGPVIDKKKCMGCGVCVVNCPQEIIELKREKREIVYKNLLEMAAKILKETNRELKGF
ncbi:MAG: 4Fe-4S binding protein [Candidatus Helarchaeota archaeon]|nr:4Fe-4S binding protein [Candidatus Helarchaeota archaeon]